MYLRELKCIIYIEKIVKKSRHSPFYEYSEVVILIYYIHYTVYSTVQYSVNVFQFEVTE